MQIYNTLTDWVNYINTLHPKEIDLGLSRVAALAKKLTLDHFNCPVITVGGTNGKGSVVKFLESVYLAAGYKVAAYTSPHLLRFNERLRVNGVEVKDEDLVKAFTYIEKNRGAITLSFFEFTTLAIFYICQQLSLDVVLLEIGLGGRLDAVNVVDHDLAIISNVAIDHTDWLGDDRESIGREKAGIIRQGKPVVCGDPNPPDSIVKVGRSLRAPFYQFQRDFFAQQENDSWQWQGPDKSYLRLPQLKLKMQNAATSLMAIELLQTRLPITQFAILSGLKKAELPAHFEVQQRPVPMVFDVAHNPQATTYLAEQLQTLATQGRMLAVVAMLQDKDIAGALHPLVTVVDHWYLASLHASRGEQAETIAALLATQKVKNCYNFASVGAAMARVLADYRPEDRVLVFGSFYTVAMAKQYLAQEMDDGS